MLGTCYYLKLVNVNFIKQYVISHCCELLNGEILLYGKQVVKHELQIVPYDDDELQIQSFITPIHILYQLSVPRAIEDQNLLTTERPMWTTKDS